MRPNPFPAFLVLPSGKVVGEPTPVSGSEIPALIVKTPAQLAAEEAAKRARAEAKAAAKAAKKEAAEAKREAAELAAKKKTTRPDGRTTKKGTHGRGRP
jgi:hypothetical protein